MYFVFIEILPVLFHFMNHCIIVAFGSYGLAGQFEINSNCFCTQKHMTLS